MGDDNRRRVHNISLYTFDINAKYYPTEIVTKYLSPYAIVGLGYTNWSSSVHINGVMTNIGLGLSVWIYKDFGLQI